MTLQQIQTHASIDTGDLAASLGFYRALLGAEPAVERHDYVRFDVSEPPLVLGLNAVPRAASTATGPLEHLGLRFHDDFDLDAARTRLRQLGAQLDEEPETECCYARLSRFWATDPSGVRWELFVAREAVVEAPTRAGNATASCDPGCCSPASA